MKGTRVHCIHLRTTIYQFPLGHAAEWCPRCGAIRTLQYGNMKGGGQRRIGVWRRPDAMALRRHG